MKIMIIPGSLRETSSSHQIVRVVKTMFPEKVQSITYDVGALPHFNDAENPSSEVTDFKDKLRDADGVLIVTPEYAFGIPGSLKNAIDWTVGTSEFVDKPVAVITASSHGQYGHAALLLVLQAVSARVDNESSFVIPSIRAHLDRLGNPDADTRASLERSIKQFIQGIETRK